MMRWLGVVLFSLVVVIALAAPSTEANEQDRLPHPWWQSDEVKAILDLTAEQAAALENIYRRTVPKQHESMRRLKTEETTLSEFVANMSVDEFDIISQIDRVEAARSEVSKTRTLMVIRMYRVLNPRQRSTLKSWRAQEPHERNSGRTRPPCY